MTRCVSVLLLALLWLPQSALCEGSGEIRYRGKYTYGHEVNVFCPDTNSQCYWLDGDTNPVARASLRNLAISEPGESYTPHCVVISGEIDRDSDRDGFAADYDGLISVSRFFGTCDSTGIVTHGDLQHHRWILSHVNGKPLNTVTLGAVPDLEFGEGMNVIGHSGCNTFGGLGVLREQFFVIPQVSATARICRQKQNDFEKMFQNVLRAESIISLDENKNLILVSADTTLKFRLKDWVW